MALYVTGDTHGEEGRFKYMGSEIMRTLTKDDYLIICGDFGYIFNDTYYERKFLRYMAEDLPFTILWVDGNHENFDLINEYPVRYTLLARIKMEKLKCFILCVDRCLR